LEPLGTITIHYPHVDDNTREVLESVMMEAENFADFTERLCTMVCTEETPILTQYLAFYFAILPGNYRLLDRFVEADRVVVMAKPLFLIMKERTGQGVSVESVRKALGNALEVAPNDWYTCHVYLSWRRLHTEMISSFTEGDYGAHPYESVIAAIEEDESLEYFEIFLHIIKADRLYEENRIANAFNLYEQAVEIAEKFDDRMTMADILFFWAQKTRYSDFGRGIDLISKANSLYEDLGDLSGVNAIRFEMAFIMASRGELNAAIDYMTEYIGSRELLAQPSDLAMCMLAFFCNHIENGEKALEILNAVHIKDGTPLPIVCWYHEKKTWALLIQGRLDEARVEFESARREVTKAGSTLFLIEVELLEGLIEKYEYNFDRAAASFMNVLESL
jgi:tetratricopeptide (TPR) repeat protein